MVSVDGGGGGWGGGPQWLQRTVAEVFRLAQAAQTPLRKRTPGLCNLQGDLAVVSLSLCACVYMCVC